MADANNQAASLPSKETELANHLWEACVEADWERVPALCDEYCEGGGSNTNTNWTDDAALFGIIDGLGDENRRNPLMAAVLHVAIDVAAAHGSFALFSDTVTQDLVDAEERKRLQSGGIMAFDNPLTTADFCPYLQMKNYGDDNYPVIDEKHRRARRKAIAKLCQTNPLWILLPMTPRGGGGKFEEDSNFDDELPRGTTALHVAVRSRNITLTRLLSKYCPKSSEIADIDGCLPLHHAVRPPDETTVLRRAVVTYQRSLNGGADNAPLDSGPQEVHSGVNLCYRGKVLFKATHESSALARCRVRRLRRNHKLRTLSAKMSRVSAKISRVKSMRLANSIVRGTGKSNSTGSSDINLSSMKSEGKPDLDSEKKCGGKNTNEESQNKNEMSESKAFLNNIYETPSSLVRAMMYLGTVEEDSTELVQSEWNIIEDGKDDDGLEARKSTIATEYPIVMDSVRTITHGLRRATRPWKTERHRTDVVKLLTLVHPQGMLYQCDDGGDTPLILACQTLQGDDGDDDEFEIEGDLEDEMDDMPNINAHIPDEIGEDAADYEMDIPQSGEGNDKPDAKATSGAQQSENEADADQDVDGTENGHEHPGPNDDGEEDPLEAVMFMLSENGSNAMGIPDDDGDTALHAATRIGASPRLVLQLIDTMPALSSTPAEDGSTPLHLACRRACDLAPEGNGGMGTYDDDMIRILAAAAGRGALIASDDEGRTPFHVACRYRASPAVLAELADSDGGRQSLLIRNSEGRHCPLGVYSRHATDYHGLRVLVERCPEAAAAMGDGRHLPLHHMLATFNLAVNVDCLRLLGSAYPPGLDLLDSCGMTPLALLCESYKSPLLSDLPKLSNGTTTLERCLSNKIWLMASYLILEAGTNTRWRAQADENKNALSGAPKELMIHATLREPSTSVEIVQLATIIHSDEVGEVDSNGDTALHLCCRRHQSGSAEDSSSKNVDHASSYSSPGYDSVFKQVNDGVVINEEPVNLENREEHSSQRQRKYNPSQDYLPILNHILELDITAAQHCNKDGKFALNLLVDKGSTWRGGGVDRVLKASPQALFSYELSNALFTMALARTASCVSSREEQMSSIGAMFQLLRGKPTSLESASRMAVKGQNSVEGRKSKRIRMK